MPGVPSGRGCDGCRKQKKKCDQAKPACSRCARLAIKCVGGGERRYKFKEQTLDLKSKKISTTGESTWSSDTWSNDSSPVPMPSNETMMIANAFIATIEVSDLRYSVSYYGAFLRQVPKRLGTNEALDASVGALASAFYCLRSRQASPQMLTQYGYALKALRVCLADPVKAQTSETLCAIYFVMICQGWIGLRDDQIVNHGEVMAHILNAAALRNGRDSFQEELVFALSIPVILASMVNPNIRLNPRLLKQAEIYGPPKPLVTTKRERQKGIKLETLSLSNLAKIPDFIRNPEVHLFDMQLIYEQKRIDITRMREHLEEYDDLPPAEDVGKFAPPVSPKTMIYLYHTAYALLLALALILNGLLRALDPSDIALLEESLTWTDEVIDIAERMTKYRPLGAGFIPICLAAAWAASSDSYRLSKIEELLADYQTDFEGARWMDGALWLKSRFEALHLKTVATKIEMQSRGSFYSDGPEDTIDLSRSCCLQ